MQVTLDTLRGTGNAGQPMREVLYDAEFQRVEALPRRLAPTLRVEALTQYLKTPQGTQKLFDEQAWVLTELYDNVRSGVGGAVGLLPVGKGKTLITLTAGTAIQAQRPLLLVPAALKKKTEKELAEYRQHWRVPANLRIVSNQLLQTLANKQLLFRYMPDLIIIDEAHEYANERSARTQRLLEYCEQFPWTTVLLLSGTLVRATLRRIGHLLSIVFPRRWLPDSTWSMSPLPHYKSRAFADWCAAIDEKARDPVAPGALWRLCAPNETVLSGIGRRLTELPGVVSPPHTQDCDASLDVYLRPIKEIPGIIRQTFAEMNTTGRTSSGDEMSDTFNQYRRYREVAFGFFYRWLWANGVVDVEWVEARRWWYKFVRRVLRNNTLGLDSVLAVKQAVLANTENIAMRTLKDDDLKRPGWFLLQEFERVRPRYNPTPPREAIWLSDYLLRDAATFDGLVWVEHQAVGERLEQMGLPYFGANDQRILTHKGPAAVSIHAHRKGHNLQRYTRNLYLCMPPSAEPWEQSIGRTHRRGQEADEVQVHVYMHCRQLYEAFHSALYETEQIAQVTKQPGKLMIATKALLTTDEVVARMQSGDPMWSGLRG